MEEKYRLYDKIVAATYTNIIILTYPDKQIFFKYNPDLYSHKVFLKVALLVANFENQKIYLKCKFFDFLKILFYYYPIREILRGRCRFRFTRRDCNPWLDVDGAVAFEAKEFAVEEEIFEEIWKEYYEK